MGDVTQILSAIEQGDPQAADELLPLVYDELRKLAAQRLGQRKAGPDASRRRHWSTRPICAWSTTTRADPMEQPRTLLRRRRRGDAAHSRRIRPPQGAASNMAASVSESISIPPARPPSRRRSICWPSTRRLSKLAASEPPKAELVKLRFFAGLTMPEAAAALGISLATAERYWTFARSWLYAELQTEQISQACRPLPKTTSADASVRGSRAAFRTD